MALDYLKTLSPVFCFALNVMIQVASFRLSSRSDLLRSIYLGFFCGLLSLSCTGLYAFFRFHLDLPEYLGFFISSLITYAALGYCYFHFLNLGETARRIRILRELYDSRQGLTYEDLLKRYNAEMMIDIRLQRLIDSNQVCLKDSRYFIRQPLVLVFARLVVIMKKLLFGKDYQLFI